MDEFGTTEILTEEQTEMQKLMKISGCVFIINQIKNMHSWRNHYAQKQIAYEEAVWMKAYEQGWKDGIEYRGRVTNKT